ncbi:MAG: DUF423 domain-containing protein [Quisquiliibacterium sp.]
MVRLFILAGALSALIAVGAGAFGAHGLKTRISSEMLQVYDTAVRYQLFHALGLLACAWLASRWPGPMAYAAGWTFILGTVLFSGSLYLLALGAPRWLGAITPLGGLAFIAGWLCIAWVGWFAKP